MEGSNEHQFSVDRHYLFMYKHTNSHLCLIVSKPEKVFPQALFFRFSWYGGTKCELVQKKDILALGDMLDGTVEVEGWKGRYQILNNNLFYKYCLEDVIKIKEE